MPPVPDSPLAKRFPGLQPALILDLDAVLTEAATRLRQGRKDEALAPLAALDPTKISSPERCQLAGLIHVGAEAWTAAVPWFAQARALRPEFLEATVRLARVLQRLGRFDEAASAFEEATKLGLSDATAHYNHGLVLRALGRDGAAIAAFDRALRLQPAYPEALRAGAILLSESGNPDGALKFLDEALRLRPDYYDAWLDRANLLNESKRYDAAIETYRAALEKFPGHPDLLNNLGAALQETGNLADALAVFDRALASRPDFPEALFNRGTTLLKTDGPDEALKCFDRALALRPAYPAALVGRGVALKQRGEFDAADRSFDAALALAPDSAHARNNRGALQLLRGNFREGWDGYEYRWACGSTPQNALKFPIAQWQGVARPGEKLIVFDEQGLGDTLQFCRYLPLLAAAGMEVTFFCRSKMIRLMRSLSATVRCVDDIAPHERFDAQIALSSLPRALRHDAATLPAQTPYLAAEPALAAKWKERLHARADPRRFKIGLCWHGNPNPKADPARSVALRHFAPLAALKDFRLISLQCRDGLDQLAHTPADLGIETLGADFDAGPDAFIDTAAVMGGLDLVITCDTSVAHLAGALARPTFLLLKRIPDWRWMLDRDDTPWYPTMRLFRQQTRGDWDEVMQRVVAAASAMRDEASRLQLRRSAAMI